MLSASKSVESLRIGSADEGCVSISFNDSWTGRKLLDYIDHDYNLHMTSKEFQVRKMNYIDPCAFTAPTPQLSRSHLDL